MKYICHKAFCVKYVLEGVTFKVYHQALACFCAHYRFMRALSYASSLDKEDLLSPINQNTLQRSSSVRSMVSNATFGTSDDYIGLALPVDINEIFQVRPRVQCFCPKHMYLLVREFVNFCYSVLMLPPDIVLCLTSFRRFTQKSN